MADTLLPPQSPHNLRRSGGSFGGGQPTTGIIEIRDIKLHLRQKNYKYTANLSCRTTKENSSSSSSMMNNNNSSSKAAERVSLLNSLSMDGNPDLASSFASPDALHEKLGSDLDASTSVDIVSQRNSLLAGTADDNNNDNDENQNQQSKGLTIEEGESGKPVPDISFGKDTKFRLSFPLSLVRDQSGSKTPRGSITPRGKSRSPSNLDDNNNTNQQQNRLINLQDKLADPEDLPSQSKLKVYITLIITKELEVGDVEKFYEQTVLVDLTKGKINQCKVQFGEVGGASFEARSVEVEEVEEVLNKSFGSLGDTLKAMKKEENKDDDDDEGKKTSQEQEVKAKDQANHAQVDSHQITSSSEQKEDEKEATANKEDGPSSEVKKEEKDKKPSAKSSSAAAAASATTTEPISATTGGGYGTIDSAVVGEKSEKTQKTSSSPSKKKTKKESDALLPKQKKKEKESSCCCCC